MGILKSCNSKNFYYSYGAPGGFVLVTYITSGVLLNKFMGVKSPFNKLSKNGAPREILTRHIYYVRSSFE